MNEEIDIRYVWGAAVTLSVIAVVASWIADLSLALIFFVYVMTCVVGLATFGYISKLLSERRINKTKHGGDS